MSDSEGSTPGSVDGTVLQDQIDVCDDIMGTIVDSRPERPESVDEADPYEQIYEIYQRVRGNSIRAFNDRFQTSALYSALKMMLRTIGDERGYEHRMRYTNSRGEERVNDSIDNGVYWFKLYASVVLETQAEITYEWAVPHFKQHRDLNVSHPTEIEPLRDGPDPTLVSSVVPLWYVLEDILRLWRQVLDMDSDHRHHREQVLAGEEEPEDSILTHRYGFIRDLDHREDSPDVGFITDYQNGENGKGSRFEVGDTDFFPSVGDVVQFRAEQQENRRGEEFGTLTVTDTISLVE